MIKYISRSFILLLLNHLFEYASLVQLVERRSPKPDVEGSSPSGRDFNKGN